MLTAHYGDFGPSRARSAGSLVYHGAAERWFDALPIGNGRIGGMVFAGESGDRIQLSESTLWSSAPSLTDVPTQAREYVPIVRELLFSGKHAEAQELTKEHLLGRSASFGTHLPLPDVRIDYPVGDGEVSVTRELDLDLDTGVAHATSSVGGASVTRETFCSNPDRVHSNGAQGTHFQIRVRVVTPTPVAADPNRLTITESRDVTVLIAIGTSWEGADPEVHARSVLDKAAEETYSSLRGRHTKDHSDLISRVSLDLGETSADVRALTTDRRRLRLAAGAEDNDLLGLYFQYGRYLTIARSRADSPEYHPTGAPHPPDVRRASEPRRGCCS